MRLTRWRQPSLTLYLAVKWYNRSDGTEEETAIQAPAPPYI